MNHHFSIWIVSPPGYIHSRCFEEVAQSLQAAFSALGYDAPIVTEPSQIHDRAIMLGANLLPIIPAALTDRLIIYNLEQIQSDSSWIKPEYIDLLKRFPVWDYSERNIAKLKEYGVNNVTLCGIGYMQVLSRISPQTEDIDVLFIGSINPRRQMVMDKIAAFGKKTFIGYNIYGKERDALIARAKILLNMHYYEAQVFEIVRVSYLLANRKCVVSESGFDAALEAPFMGGVAFMDYNDLPTSCVYFLERNEERIKWASSGFDCFSRLSQVPMLQKALKMQGA